MRQTDINSVIALLSLLANLPLHALGVPCWRHNGRESCCALIANGTAVCCFASHSADACRIAV